MGGGGIDGTVKRGLREMCGRENKSGKKYVITPSSFGTADVTKILSLLFLLFIY